LTFVRVGGRLRFVQVRRNSASADAAKAREQERLARLSILERMAKALALGRRGRRVLDMANEVTAKGHG
jgi:hypothetical protein